MTVMSRAEGGWAYSDKLSALGDRLWLRPEVQWEGKEEKRRITELVPA